MSLALEFFSVYVRAPQRNLVQLNSLNESALKALKLDSVPTLMRQTTEVVDGKESTVQQQTSSPYTIMLDIAKACYLEEILFGKVDSAQRLEISSFIEQAERLPAQELIEVVNTHIGQSRMFLCGLNITAADIVVFAHLARQFAGLADHEKIALPHAFRWVDHVQHLPGLLEQVKAKALFTSFPDENAEGPSKA
jgi:hypothetical protein